MEKIPSDRCYKCNKDGASRANPGPSSYGFCVRDWKGDMVFAQWKKIEETTNAISEARVVMEGVRFCVTKKSLLVVIDTDSTLIRNILNGEWKAPWCIASLVDKIRVLMEDNNMTIQHVIKEGNKMADF
ncbi:uncharacterized protein LOC132628344 [Lycium barbarum]|uniref:uncharacterized protein LOC132628344 n=1 Tax=Lycium barbarum TaxID=112863 RepID=UPI00293F2321|nr:uncharacterized protein LOC132628344 [Lycium barbarum]